KSYKAGAVFIAIGLVQLLFFGIFGRQAEVGFELSRPDRDLIQLPVLQISSAAFGAFVGVVLVILGCVSLVLAKRNRSTPRWAITLISLLAVLGMLGWLAADKTVPLIFIFGTALVLSIPIMLGAMAGVMSERVGVVNIAIEGQLLSGAFTGAVVGSITDNLILALVAAMIVGALFSTVLAVFAVRFLAQQIIVGVVLNVLAIGITNFLYQQWLSGNAEDVNFPGTLEILKIPLLGDIPLIGPILFENRLTVFLALAIVAVLWFVLFKTKLGLRARAVGEHPLAADTVGIDVGRTRFWWVTIGGAVAGLGGAALTVGNAGAFGKEMSNGYGFIALAVVILGRWHPIYAAAAALLFGFAIILRIWANTANPGIPTDFIGMVPYLVTLIAVVGFVGRTRPPAADGIPYEKSH
ncbi:MAG: hypothetical protein RL198_612, partial [Actinomycetota bacterium]